MPLAKRKAGDTDISDTPTKLSRKEETSNPSIDSLINQVLSIPYVRGRKHLRDSKDSPLCPYLELLENTLDITNHSWCFLMVETKNIVLNFLFDFLNIHN